MATIPPKPPNAPDIGSIWYCQVAGGWPGWWKPQARWGNPIKVTDVVYSSGVWKVRFNTYWNPNYGYVGCTIAVSQFHNYFGLQKLLVTKQGWVSFGEGRPVPMLRRISATGRAQASGGPNGRVYCLHALSSTGHVTSPRKKPIIYRTY